MRVRGGAFHSDFKILAVALLVALSSSISAAVDVPIWTHTNLCWSDAIEVIRARSPVGMIDDVLCYGNGDTIRIDGDTGAVLWKSPPSSGSGSSGSGAAGVPSAAQLSDTRFFLNGFVLDLTNGSAVATVPSYFRLPCVKDGGAGHATVAVHQLGDPFAVLSCYDDGYAAAGFSAVTGAATALMNTNIDGLAVAPVKQVLVVDQDDVIAGLDIQSGKQVWSWPANHSDPWQIRGMVFATMQITHRQRSALDVVVVGGMDGVAHEQRGVDPRTGATLWTIPISGAVQYQLDGAPPLAFRLPPSSASSSLPTHLFAWSFRATDNETVNKRYLVLAHQHSGERVFQSRPREGIQLSYDGGYSPLYPLLAGRSKMYVSYTLSDSKGVSFFVVDLPSYSEECDAGAVVVRTMTSHTFFVDEQEAAPFLFVWNEGFRANTIDVFLSCKHERRFSLSPSQVQGEVWPTRVVVARDRASFIVAFNTGTVSRYALL